MSVRTAPPFLAVSALASACLQTQSNELLTPCWDLAASAAQLCRGSCPQCPSQAASGACGFSAHQEFGRVSAPSALWLSCSQSCLPWALWQSCTPGWGTHGQGSLPGVTQEGTCHQCCWWLSHSSQTQKLGKHVDPWGILPRMHEESFQLRE